MWRGVRESSIALSKSGPKRMQNLVTALVMATSRCVSLQLPLRGIVCRVRAVSVHQLLDLHTCALTMQSFSCNLKSAEAGGSRRFDPWVRGVWLVNRRVTHPLPPPSGVIWEGGVRSAPISLRMGGEGWGGVGGGGPPSLDYRCRGGLALAIKLVKEHEQTVPIQILMPLRHELESTYQ